jgi:PAS domain S-box-containing protein
MQYLNLPWGRLVLDAEDEVTVATHTLDRQKISTIRPITGLLGAIVIRRQPKSRIDPALLQEQSRILETIAAGAPLVGTLRKLIAFVEAREPGALCAILIVSDDGVHLSEACGPGLGETWVEAQYGVAIAPPHSSAWAETAWTGRATEVPDIVAETRYPAAWRDILLAAGLGAVYCTPVLGPDGRAIATIALYYDTARDPSPTQPAPIALAAQLIAIAARDARGQRAVVRRSHFSTLLADRLRRATGPDDVLAGAAELLGQHIGANVAAYAQVDNNRAVVARDWTEGDGASLVGSFDLAAFGTGGAAALQADRDVAVAGGGAFRSSYIAAPLCRGDKLTSLTIVASDRPRTWTAEEIGLVRQVGELTSAALERLEARTALLTSEEQHRVIVESAHDYAIVTLDPNGSIVGWNTGAERLIGHTAAEVVGQPGNFFRLPEEAEAAAFRLELDEARSVGRVLTERWYRRKDGSRFWGSGMLIPLRAVQRGGYVKIVQNRTTEHEAGIALRESEARLLAAQRAGGIGTFEWYPDLNRLEVSDEYRRIWGIPWDMTVTADLLVSLVRPSDRANTGPARIASHENPVEYAEYRINRMDTGEERWVARRGDVLPAIPGGRAPSAPRFLGVTFDVTDRKRTEAALRRSEEEFHTLADNLPSLCWMAHPDGWIYWYNRRWYEYTGTEPADMEGWGWQSVHDPAILPAVMARWPACIAAGEAFEMIFPLRGADGIFRYFLTRAVPVRDTAGAITRWFGNNVDISEQQHIAEVLREQEASLKIAIETGNFGSWQLDFQTGMVTADTVCARNFGLCPTDSIDLAHFFDRIHAEDAPHVWQKFQAAIDLRLDYHAEYRTAWPDGKTHWIAARGRAFYGEDGTPLRMIGVTQDITAQMDSEEVLRNWNEQLETRVAEEVAAREAAQDLLSHAQRMEALGQLAAGIAHDFNNVLQAVSIALDLIQKRAEEPQHVRQVARMATRAADRGAGITGRLLAFARKGELRAASVDCLPLLTNLREILKSTLGAAISMVVDIAENTPQVWVDPAQLETVLVNLAVNARDAMPDGGTLTLAVQPERIGTHAGHPARLSPGRYVRMDVGDNGTGMDAATLAKASEAFFTTKGPEKGTGLGLAMARGFAEQSAGGLAIASTPGVGTTVSLWFPEGGATVELNDPPVAEQAVSSSRTAAHVLIVDDNHIVREVLSQQFEELGYEISQLDSGPAALAKLDAGHRVDLLITDFSMPGMNGLDLTREARRRRPDLPVMLMTGYADTDLQSDMEAFQDRATILVRKPVSGEDLANHAAALLIRREAAA